MMKKILPAAVLSLSLISCQMGLTNLAGNEGANPRNSIGANAQEDTGIEIAYDERNVYLRIDVPEQDSFNIFVNSDGDKTNGHALNWIWPDGYADYRVCKAGRDSNVVLCVATDWSGKYIASVSSEYDNTAKKLNVTIPLSDLKITSSDIPNLGFGYLSGDEMTSVPEKGTSFAKACKEVELTDSRISLSYDKNYIYVSVNEEKDIYEMRLYVNSDGDVSTGENFWPWAEKTGADYLISKTGNSNPVITNLISNEKNAPTNCYCEYKNCKSVFIVPLEALKVSYANINSLSFGYYSLDSGWNEATVIPEKWGKPLVSVGKTEQASDDTVKQKVLINQYEDNDVNFNFACNTHINKKGIIIPAYIHASSTAEWDALVKAAEKFSERKDDVANIDFYVVITGPNKGPAEFNEFYKIKEYLQQIKKYGGKIIGYVHTCNSQQIEGGSTYAKFSEHVDGKTYDYYTFRSIKEVIDDIDTWNSAEMLDGLLDGVWLDEFYPRYEVGTDVAKDADGKQVADWKDFLIFPNLNEGEDYKDVENIPSCCYKLDEAAATADPIEPFGGYYYRLCKAIRKAYPNLIKIGNAGAALDSNQLEYGKLVDILVSIEKSYDDALKGGNIWNPISKATEYFDSNLDFSSKCGGTAEYRLALIHGAATDEYANVINNVFENDKYTHVCVSDNIYNESAGMGVWNKLPSELDTEVTALIGKDNFKK